MQESPSISNPHGLRLATLIDTPTPLTKHPAVILLHGFTGYKEELHIAQLAQTLAHNNIVAIRFDASGFGESEGTLEHDYRLSNYYQDLEVVYNWLKKQDYVDTDRIGIWGPSMGGLLSIAWGSNHREISAICAVSPPTHMGESDFLSTIREQWQQSGWWEHTSSKYGTIKVPYAFLEDAQDYNALNYIPQLTNRQILIIAGSRDEIVPPHDSKKIFDALSGSTKRFVEVEGMGHLFKNDPNHMQQVTDLSLDFFTNYL